MCVKHYSWMCTSHVHSDSVPRSSSFSQRHSLNTPMDYSIFYPKGYGHRFHYTYLHYLTVCSLTGWSDKHWVTFRRCSHLLLVREYSINNWCQLTNTASQNWSWHRSEKCRNSWMLHYKLQQETHLGIMAYVVNECKSLQCTCTPIISNSGHKNYKKFKQKHNMWISISDGGGQWPLKIQWLKIVQAAPNISQKHSFYLTFVGTVYVSTFSCCKWESSTAGWSHYQPNPCLISFLAGYLPMNFVPDSKALLQRINWLHACTTMTKLLKSNWNVKHSMKAINVCF